MQFGLASVSALIVALLAACSTEQITIVRLPEELGISERIFLGQKMKVLTSDSAFKYDRSWGSHYARTDDNKYFFEVSLNGFGYGGDVLGERVERIYLPSKIHSSPEDWESAAWEIVSVLIGTFGEHFAVVDQSWALPKHLRKPQLVWELDSCAVLFAMLPAELHRRTLLSGQRQTSPEYGLMVVTTLRDSIGEQSITLSRETVLEKVRSREPGVSE